MNDKIQITFDPLRQDRLLTTAEALKELHEFYEDLLTAGFEKGEAIKLMAEILTGQVKQR